MQPSNHSLEENVAKVPTIGCCSGTSGGSCRLISNPWLLPMSANQTKMAERKYHLLHSKPTTLSPSRTTYVSLLPGYKPVEWIHDGQKSDVMYVSLSIFIRFLLTIVV